MFDWHQTPQTVTISIPLAYKVDSRKVDAVIAENYIKLNIPEMKIFKFIDLYDQVDIESSKVIIEDNKINFYLSKLRENNWPQAEFKSTNKEELKERRKIAEDKLNEKIKIDRDMAEKKRVEFDKFVVDKSIKIDEERRKELREKKSSEKNEAERELYQFVNQMEKIEKMENKNEIIDNNVKMIAEEKNYEEELIDTTPVKFLPTSVNIPSKNNNNEIFDEKSLVHYNPEIKPTEPRQQTNIKVNLTEKLIPHFAARESLSKEPPYPKSKKYAPEKNMLGQEIEDRNPIWIKEKADNFFKNKDYRSAINAYNRSIELVIDKLN